MNKLDLVTVAVLAGLYALLTGQVLVAIIGLVVCVLFLGRWVLPERD
jgi:hypothetical protein